MCVRAASFPCRFSDLRLNFLLASAYCTRAHTLSLDNYCRPTAGKSSSPAGLSTLVYAYVVDRAPASPYTYSSSTHTSQVPDELTTIESIRYCSNKEQPQEFRSAVFLGPRCVDKACDNEYGSFALPIACAQRSPCLRPECQTQNLIHLILAACCSNGHVEGTDTWKGRREGREGENPLETRSEVPP